MTPAVRAMLGAHLRFELDRWRDDHLTESIGEEVDAAYEWLAVVTLQDLAPEPELLDRLARARDAEITDAIVRIVTDAVDSVRGAAAADDRPISELVPREVFEEYVGLVMGMQDARRALIEQVTTSEVYSELIAHVLYHGIKNYLMSESPIARRVPGASSLMRLGQNALSSTGLDRGIDRQLTSFVNANISDSIRESKDYLETALDEQLLRQVADELWSSNAEASLADAVALMSDETAAGFVATTRGLIEALLASASLWTMAEQAIGDFYVEHGDRPVRDLLLDAGVTAPKVTEFAAQWAAPAVARALADGQLERRIRARLEPFYKKYRVTARARSARS